MTKDEKKTEMYVGLLVEDQHGLVIEQIERLESVMSVLRQVQVQISDRIVHFLVLREIT